MLHTLPSYPQSRSYVLQMHRDANAGRLLGRVVHIASGQVVDFACGATLLAWLEAQLGPANTPPSPESPTP
jgi:hypothetical protein